MMVSNVSTHFSRAPSFMEKPCGFSSDSGHVLVCCIHTLDDIPASGAKLLNLYAPIDIFISLLLIFSIREELKLDISTFNIIPSLPLATTGEVCSISSKKDSILLLSSITYFVSVVTFSIISILYQL